ncbi:MAG: glycosyltransferase family 1 protein, partial [Paracoccus sp. (in: a-proteobacteria)]|nr:glycosyltransferase family 1 protein [Paracoccus sp. (in: a-proteobacteria)]
SRLVSRLGQGPLTGIDRVEIEWLRHLQARPHLLLARVTGAQLLLPPEAGAVLLSWLEGATEGLPRPHWRDRLRGRDGLPERAGAALRGMAVSRAGRGARGLGVTAAAKGVVAYLNVGHSNLTPAVLAAMAPLRRAVMIHDTIPLDHPEYTRAGQSVRFRDRLMAALSLADVILTVSEATAADVLRWRGRLSVQNAAPVVTTRIGTRLTAPDPAAIAHLDTSRPYFVSIGTIEPRKNHALLLDVWDRLAAHTPADKMPRLFIIGRRGWAEPDLLARLDRLPPGGLVVELNDLSDAGVAALLQGARALLMPSFAEGFGLPLTEAAAQGVPVIAAPLAASRENLGDAATWIAPGDAAGWANAVAQHIEKNSIAAKKVAPFGWDRHFQLVTDALSRRLNDNV